MENNANADAVFIKPLIQAPPRAGGSKPATHPVGDSHIA